MSHTRLALITLLSLTTACGQEFMLSHSSPSFADGYRAGCQNGTSNASNKTGEFVRDEKRYETDSEYAHGWRNGNRECNGDSFRGNPNDPLQPIEIDGVGGVYTN